MKRLIAFLAGSLLACAAPAATFQIVNLDGAGEGLNDPTVVSPEGGNPGTTRGQQRLNLLQAAANVWGARLQSNRTIKVGARFDSITNPACTPQTGGVLGFAGPTNFFQFASPPVGYQPNTWYAVAQVEAVLNAEVNGANNEINATFNSDIDTGCLGAGTRFWYGTDPQVPVPAGRVALFPTALHELGHGLGFLTLVCTNATGCGGNGGFGSLALGVPDIWTFFLKNAQTGELWKDMTDQERQASMTSDPNLIWDGPNVTAAIPVFQPTNAGVNGATGRMRMHAPGTIQPGSSISHFTTAAANPDLLMEPVLSNSLFDGVDMTVPLFRDIGWPVPPVGGTFSINDRSLAEGNSGTQNMGFTVSRSNSTETASVTVNTQNVTATAGSDYTALVNTVLNFAVGEGSKTVNVVIAGDTTVEPDETFNLVLSNPTAGFTLADATGIGTIQNDDVAPALSVNDPSVSEGNAGTRNLTFTITLSATSNQVVSVNFATANGSATTANNDYVATSGTANIAIGQLTTTVNVTINGDTTGEPDETVFLNLTTPVNATIADPQGTGTILDDDNRIFMNGFE